MIKGVRAALSVPITVQYYMKNCGNGVTFKQSAQMLTKNEEGSVSAVNTNTYKVLK